MATFKLKCNSCGKSNSYDCSDICWECVESNERGMGQENHYEASLEYTCSCSNNINIVFHCWEYPVGSVNTTDIEVSGANLVDSECASCPNLHPNEDQ